MRWIHVHIGRMIQPAHSHCSYHVKPHKPVTSQRLANWLKEILGKAGIDTTVFKAHSVRGASSTAAAEKGVHIEDILRTAD